MDTSELRLNIVSLDQTAKALGDNISQVTNAIRNCHSQAEQCRNTAAMIMNNAMSQEDASAISRMADQANSYYARASYYESEASKLEGELQGFKDQLRCHREDYVYYKNEGETMLQDLMIAADKLVDISQQIYGGQKAIQALNNAKQKLTYTKSLIDACNSRIAWIDQVCGSGAGRPQKTLKRR